MADNQNMTTNQTRILEGVAANPGLMTGDLWVKLGKPNSMEKTLRSLMKKGLVRFENFRWYTEA